jgi:hypothetical protein
MCQLVVQTTTNHYFFFKALTVQYRKGKQARKRLLDHRGGATRRELEK